METREIGAALSVSSIPATRSRPRSAAAISADQAGASLVSVGPGIDSYSASFTDVEPVLTTRMFVSGLPMPVADVGEIFTDRTDVCIVADEFVGHVFA